MKNMFLFMLYFCITLFFFPAVSCAKDVKTVSIFEVDGKKLPLYALNKNAVSRFIKGNETPYAFYSFQSYVPSEKNALVIDLEAVDFFAGSISFGFLYTNDFNEKNHLKPELQARNMLSVLIDEKKFLQYGKNNKKIRLSLKVPDSEQLEGFFVEASIPLKITSIKEAEPFYGWSYLNDIPIFGAFENYLFDLYSTDIDFSELQHKDGKIVIYFDEMESLEGLQPTVNLRIGSDEYSVQLAPQLKKATFYTNQITDWRTHPSMKLNASKPLKGVNFIRETTVPQFSPMIADSGLMLSWNQKTWRNPAYEFFSWESFPSVLVFDTLSYKIQDNFFKRLAFFVEKSGYKGKVMSLKDIADMHAFNAHDYKAVDLAEFFTKAQREGFTLTDEENMLRNILLEHKILLPAGDGYDAGEGAVLSISRESSKYLREVFMVHEGLHGLFFIDESFRNIVMREFHEMDPQSLEFLLQYFTVTPSLAYDANDSYLMYNEFMAYVLQQPPSQIRNYFTQNIASRQFIRRARPDLVSYIINTEAKAFSEVGQTLSQYIYKRWGYFGGRLTLITK
ncbi:MAG: hypothetical protein ACRC5H_07095 [Treponemataceae bacterium]